MSDSSTTSRTVLLLGRLPFDSDQWNAHVDDPAVELRFGNSVADARQAFDAGPIDHVIMGAGLPLPTRLEIVEAVFSASEATTLHMKDRASGREGMVAFVRAILRSLEDA